MFKSELHTFHIPVMGLGYTVDTPVKSGRFGITSVVSIIEDELLEQMRKFYCEKENENFVAIENSDIDYRAKRITAYLNLLQAIGGLKFIIKKSEFPGNLMIQLKFHMFMKIPVFF